MFDIKVLALSNCSAIIVLAFQNAGLLALFFEIPLFVNAGQSFSPDPWSWELTNLELQHYPASYHFLALSY